MRGSSPGPGLLGLALLGDRGRWPSSPGCGGGSNGKRIIILTNGELPLLGRLPRRGHGGARRISSWRRPVCKTDFEVNDGTPKGQLDKLRQFASQSDVVAVGISVTWTPQRGHRRPDARAAEEGRPRHHHRLRRRTARSSATPASPSSAPTTWPAAASWAVRQGTAARRRRVRHLRRPHRRPERHGAHRTASPRGPATSSTRWTTWATRSTAPRPRRTSAPPSPTTQQASTPSSASGRTTPRPSSTWSKKTRAEAQAHLHRRRLRRRAALPSKRWAKADRRDGGAEPLRDGLPGVKLMKALVQDDQKTIKEMLPKLRRGGRRHLRHGPEGRRARRGLAAEAGDVRHRERTSSCYKLSDFQEWLKKYNLTGS